MEYFIEEISRSTSYNIFDGVSSIKTKTAAPYTNVFDESIKWYEWREELSAFSTSKPEYKDLVFHITGSGEEPGDHWAAYVCNGKVQMCEARIVYDDFNESLFP